MIQEFYPGEEDGGLRIDKYLSQAAEGLSRSYIQWMSRRLCSRILSRSLWSWIFSTRMRM